MVSFDRLWLHEAFVPLAARALRGDIVYHRYPRFEEETSARLSNPNSLEKEEVKKIEYEIKLYPNPTTGLFNIKFNEEFTGNISIINYLGQHVKSPEILKRTHSAQLDLSNHSARIYFVLVRSADGREYKTYKVVKQ